MGNNASTIHDQIFELKFASKSMAREAKKSEKQMRKQRIAVKKVLLSVRVLPLKSEAPLSVGVRL